jgi:NADPH-dependent 2,4-dienoyl-CoA reductase/sulfur reductase-like enzyme/rhodanese-related sulfurtransferase
MSLDRNEGEARGKKVVIVGGVAGGASCAARLRRQREDLEIILLDRGKYVSFANCGLPYYVGEVITDEAKLLVATPELFQERFNIQVRVETDVLAIDRTRKELSVRDLATGKVTTEGYDVLVLSPGATPVVPPLPGINLPGIFALRTIPDSRRIREWINERNVRSAVVIGGGFVGLEMAENLVHKGLTVTLLELGPQVMPPFDPEMAHLLHQELRAHGVNLRLGDGAASFEATAGGIKVKTRNGAELDAGLVFLAIGVKPETTLARTSGLELGATGGIAVDEQMRTSDPDIFAVGDVVEVKTVPLGRTALIALAGPANRQARVAADVIAGKGRPFRGVQGTAVCGVFGLTAALTGEGERSLKRAGHAHFGKVYLNPGHHAAYYPGAKPIFIKLLFDLRDGRVLGFQAVGEEGVEKRVDVVAMALQMGATVYDLEEAELCYAPQYGAAKDPVNVAGMIASNILRGDLELADWESLDAGNKMLLDVRGPEEFASGHVPLAINIPLPLLRKRMNELAMDKEIWVYCGVGQRSYYACRALTQHGFHARSLPGGFQAYRSIRPDGPIAFETG